MFDMDALWQGALTELREQLGKQNFETWIKPIRFNEQRVMRYGLMFQTSSFGIG